MSKQFSDLLDKCIEDKRQVQLKFRNDANPGPLGPGKIERVSAYDGLYRMFTPAIMVQNGKQQPMLLPVIFHISDLLWIGEEPIVVDQPQVLAPGGRRSAGGIVIPGGS